MSQGTVTSWIKSGAKRVANDRELLRDKPEELGRYTTSRTIKVLTTHDPKGWRWVMTYNGEQIARGRHHVPLEILAIRQACKATVQVLAAKMGESASPEEVIRADKWEERAKHLSAMAGVAGGPKPSDKRPARLECGHIRLLRPSTRLGGLDSVNCGECCTHRGVAAWLES